MATRGKISLIAEDPVSAPRDDMGDARVYGATASGAGVRLHGLRA